MDLEARKKLGIAKKLWKIEVLFSVEYGSTRRYVLCNQTGAEVRNFREYVFTIGVMVPLDPGHWIVAKPADIWEVHLWRQGGFIEDEWKA